MIGNWIDLWAITQRKKRLEKEDIRDRETKRGRGKEIWRERGREGLCLIQNKLNKSTQSL